MLALFLEEPTEDSVDLAAEFMIECGQVLSETTPAGVNSIFERFRSILHEGQIDRRVQYTIEKLFAIRKTKFSNHPGVIPELDLIEEQDKITHDVSLEDELETEEATNFFKFDPEYETKEAQWDEIKKEILGEYADQLVDGYGKRKPPGEGSDSESSDLKVPGNQAIDHQNVSE